MKYEVLTGKDLIAALRGGRAGDLLDDAAYTAADEIVRLRGLLAETNAKMMILHNESISLHARLAEATGIINQRALELADTQGQLTEAKRDAARYRARLAAAKKHTPECSYWDGLMAQVCNCGATGHTSGSAL